MDEQQFTLVNGRRAVRRQMWGKNGSEFLNGVTMQMHWSYGCNQNVSQGNSYLIDEETLIYLCGRHIVKFDIGRRKQSFIQKLLDEEEVVSMAYSVSPKGVLSIAVGFRNNKSAPMVRIYKSNKKEPYTLIHHHLTLGSHLVSVHLVQHAKYLVTLGQSEKLMFVSFFKSNDQKLITYNELHDPLFSIFGSFTQHNTFGVIGPKYLKIWEYNEEEKVLDQSDLICTLDENYNEEFLHAINLTKNEYVLCLTTIGDLLLFRKKQLVQKITIEVSKKDIEDTIGDSSKNAPEAGVPKGFTYYPVTMSPTQTGVVIGYRSLNLLSVYDLHKDQKLYFKKHYKFNVPNFYRIVSLHVGAEDGFIAITIQHQQKQINNLFDRQPSQILNESQKESDRKVYTREENVSNLEVYLFNYGIVDVINTALRDPFECLFPQGVHKSRIMDIEYCPSKSILTTLSEDKLVKIWEFQQSRGEFKCVYSITLHENPQCISLHPMAFQCVIGYREGLKFYFVLEDDLKQVHFENLKQCTAVKYSGCGHYLAVGTQTQINVYNPYSYQLVKVLNGHVGTIQYINWISGDQMISSNCSQGLVLCFDVFTEQRLGDHAYKTHKQLCSQYDDDYDLLVAAYIDQKVRIFEKRGEDLVYEMDVYPASYTCVYIAKFLDALFFGTSQGSVRAYLWPFTNFQTKQQEFVEIALHQGPVQMIRLSPDLNYMMSGSEEGSIYICSLKEFRDGSEYTVTEMLSKDLERSNFSIANLYSFNQLTFVSRANQESKRDQIKELEFRISNLKTDIDDEKEQIMNNYNGQIKTLEERNRHDVAQQKEFLSAIMEESDARYKSLEQQLDELRAQHKQFLETMELETNVTLLKLYEKSDHLKQIQSAQSQNMENELNDVKAQYQKVLKEVEDDFNSKYSELYERFQTSQENMKLDERKFAEVFKQSEKEQEILLQDTRKQLEEDLQISTTKSEELRSSNTKFTKENERFTQRRAELESLIKETETQIDHLRTERKNFEGKNEEMVSQLKEKEGRINLKEQEIKNYRNKNHHLQNFRAVYDYRVNTLIEEKQPLLEHLQHLESNVKVMYKELIDESEAQKKIKENLAASQKAIRQLKNQLKIKNETLFKSKSQMVSLQYDILQVLKTDKIEQFQQMLTVVHREHFIDAVGKVKEPTQIGNHKIGNQETDEFLVEMEKTTQEAIKEELLRQRDFLSKKTNAVCRLNKQNEEDRDELILRVQNENTNLIRECNTLREEKKGLKEHFGNMQKAFDILNKELESMGHIQDQSQSNIDLDDLDLVSENMANQQSKPYQPKNAHKPTAFQRYHNEKQEHELKRFKQTQSLPKLKAGPENQELLVNLLKEIQMFGGLQSQDEIATKLKDQVQSFIKSEESQVILPMIRQNNVSQMLSQEETQIAMNEVSGANTSIESKLFKNSFQLKKSKPILKPQLPPIK